LTRLFNGYMRCSCHRAYIDGMDITHNADLHELRSPLKERAQERIGIQCDALALAMCILTSHFADIRNEVDLGNSLSMQCEDGGWEARCVYLKLSVFYGRQDPQSRFYNSLGQYKPSKNSDFRRKYVFRQIIQTKQANPDA
jgi:hypothetical protein